MIEEGLLTGFDPTLIKDEKAREGYILLLNLVEELKAENERLRAENQRLRDELNRLKGEQGKPEIKGKTQREVRKHSSEAERRRSQKSKSRKERKGGKAVRIDQVKRVELDRSTLPADAVFKGYERAVVQDLRIESNNILFLKEKFYSASERKTYIAPQPAGYEGQFGPTIKALTLTFYYSCHMTEPKILEFFHNMGVEISSGEVSNLVIKGQERFHAEKTAIYRAGLESSPWQQSDWTTMRVNGQNYYTHIVCNPLYAAYFTKKGKDRLTILEVLRNSDRREYLLNEEAFSLLAAQGLSQTKQQQLQGLKGETLYSEREFLALLDTQPFSLGSSQRRQVLTAAAIAAYHAQEEWPVIDLLLVDDAPEYRWLTSKRALCWVHEGRHYKKLMPFIEHHRHQLDATINAFWSYYGDLLAYKEQPSAEKKDALAARFRELFGQKTSYWLLDERLGLTLAKEEFLLRVLDHPEIPLHNNAAELAARARVRKRKISYGARTEEGAQAWDTFMTISETGKRLGVSFYHYIRDRIVGEYRLPSLADLIRQRALEMNLGLSWQYP